MVGPFKSGIGTYVVGAIGTGGAIVQIIVVC